MIRTIREDEVTFTLDAEDEDIPVRGNAMSSDDPDLDKRVEDEIIRRLDRGDIWAWCYVKLTASITLPDGTKVEAWTGLGGCSYDDEEDFKRGGYYDDMKHEVLDELRTNIEASIKLGVMLSIIFGEQSQEKIKCAGCGETRDDCTSAPVIVGRPTMNVCMCGDGDDLQTAAEVMQ